MDFVNLHTGSRIWHFVEDGKFSLEYQTLENYFNSRSRTEGVLTEKQYIHIKEVEVDKDQRVFNLTTELYRLLEN